MAMTMSATTLTFNDSTTQTTAASAVNSFLGIGECMMLLNSTTGVIPVGATYSGSYLYYQSASGTTVFSFQNHNFNIGGNYTNTTASSLSTAQNGTIVNISGTWRAVSSGRFTVCSYNVDGYGYGATTIDRNLYRRIA